MAEGQFLFTLDYEQFMENWGESILRYLKEEFDRSKISLSRSLLLSTETENSYWLLVDFEKAAGKNQETRDAVLLACTDAIFDANQSGYLSVKTSRSESGAPKIRLSYHLLPNSQRDF